MNLDEATKSYIATKKLRTLYDAYWATSRAQAFVIKKGASVQKFNQNNDDNISLVRFLHEQMTSTSETEMVFVHRAIQLDRRILELREYIPND